MLKPELTDLCKLALKYHTDKCWLGFTAFYHRLLQGRQVHKVLEIGIGNAATLNAARTAGMDSYTIGASLFMWRDYFPEAEIYGLDVVESSLINEGRIKSFLCNQGDADALREIGEKLGKFDLVIDDGSHKPEHQVLSAQVLVPFVNSGGVYVIEDVAHPQLVRPQLPFVHEVWEFSQPICDDRIIVIHR